MSEFIAVATALMSLGAALAYWRWFAAVESKGPLGVMVKTASTGFLALAFLAVAPGGDWVWLIGLGLALGALGDLCLALKGKRWFLAGVAAFGLGHLAYAGGFLLRAQALGFDGLSGGEVVLLLVLGALLGSTEVWLSPRTGSLRGPVRAYVGLIGLMGLAALLLPAGPGQLLLRLGAICFIASDLMLALQLFVARDPAQHRRLALSLWPVYWIAQALIASGALVFWAAALP